MTAIAAQMLATIICSALASSGLWAYLQKRAENKELGCQHTIDHTEMLIGLGHDRIIHLGMTYIERGCITKDEYENLKDYLYSPYEKLGGNGSAKRIMQIVDTLPICPTQTAEGSTA